VGVTALIITPGCRASIDALPRLINEASSLALEHGAFPQMKSVSDPIAQAGAPGQAEVMTQTYAVLWREGEGPIYAGTAEPGARGLRLEGSRHGRSASLRTIPYDDLAGLRFTRGVQECLYGKPTLMLEPAEGGAVRIASMNGVGMLRDLEGQISAFAPNLPVD
jgi:hypothetical protein